MPLQARGAASLAAMGGSPDDDAKFSTDTPAGWHMIFWWSAVVIIGFFLWAL